VGQRLVNATELNGNIVRKPNKENNDNNEKDIFNSRPAAHDSSGRNGADYVHRDREGRHGGCRQLVCRPQPCRGRTERDHQVQRHEEGEERHGRTTADLGKIAGADGNIYNTKAAAEAAYTQAVAMIAYVGSETDHATYKHGLAIALSDEGTMNWSTAKSTCEAKNISTCVANASWMLPSHNQWKAMFKANGGSDASCAGLNTALATAGGDSSKFQPDRYWSSTEREVRPGWAWMFAFDDDRWGEYPENLDNPLVRACLVF